VSANSRLSVAVHTLAWIGLYQRLGHEVATSEQVAGSVNTNPVVIRRLLCKLRDAGLVASRRGTGAGWTLTRDPAEITLLDVHDALEDGPVFGLHTADPNPDCVVGAGIRPALSHVYERLDATLREELARTTVDAVLKDVLTSR
jgi:DNA-binding IscR family transcriptional regulator